MISNNVAYESSTLSLWFGVLRQLARKPAQSALRVGNSNGVT